MAESLKPNALVRLVGSYPSHGFVIDRKEAADLFTDVVAPEGPTNEIYRWARQLITTHQYPERSPLVLNVKEFLESLKTRNERQAAHDDHDTEGNPGNARENSDNSGPEGQSNREHTCQPSNLNGDPSN